MTNDILNEDRSLLGTFLNVLRKGHARGFPQGSRGHTLIIIGDFSGTHRGSKYLTYSFLALDLDRNPDWFRGQRAFRAEVLRDRRMSYKALNDASRLAALIPFLDLANRLTGSLVVFIIPRDFGSLTVADANFERDEFLSAWKTRIHEHLIRVTHLGGITAAFMSRPQQNLFFIVDQDEIASNVIQLTKLTTVFSHVLGNCLDHSLGHIRVGTTWSDDGSLALEDLAAIADLSAGCTWELICEMAAAQRLPKKGLLTPLPRTISKKSQLIGRWLAHSSPTLRRTLLFLDGRANDTSARLSTIDLQPMFQL